MSSSRRTDLAGRTGGRLEPAGWSLRARLLAVQILLLSLVCVIIGLATQLALHSLLFSQINDSLGSTLTSSQIQYDTNPNNPATGSEGQTGQNDSGNQNSEGDSANGDGQHNVPGPGFLLARGTPPNTLGALISSSGSVLQAGILAPLTRGHPGDTSKVAASDYALLTALKPGARPTTVTLTGYGDYEVKAVTVSDGSTLIVGLPLKDIESTQTELTWVFIGVAGGGLLTAGVIGALIIRRTLRPLRRVAATAGRVAEMPLDRGEVALSVRVPEVDTDPRTEVGQVGAALNRMLGHIAAALTARQASEMRVRQFVADASHELRTPLAAIRGYAELARRSRDQVPPDIANALRRVESESKRMTTLVEDLLLLARLDSGRPLDREPVDLSMLVIDAVSDAHVAGKDHNWRLELPDEPVSVVGDSARLHQVLANLLTNARNHTPPGTTVVTGITVSPHGEAVLTVTDDGPGIPKDLLPQVFDRFARGDSSRSRAAGSTGLGLAIVSAVVASHHGTVSVESRPGRTCFIVRLPGALSGGPAAGGADNAAADLHTMPIALPPGKTGRDNRRDTGRRGGPDVPRHSDQTAGQDEDPPIAWPTESGNTQPNPWPINTHSPRTGQPQRPNRWRAEGGRHDRARP